MHSRNDIRLSNHYKSFKTTNITNEAAECWQHCEKYTECFAFSINYQSWEICYLYGGGYASNKEIHLKWKPGIISIFFILSFRLVLKLK